MLSPSAANVLAMTCGGPPAADLHVTTEASRQPAGRSIAGLGVPTVEVSPSQNPRLFSPALPPIVNQIDTRPVVSSLVRAVHRDALKVCTEVTLKHNAVSFVSGSIDPGGKPR